MLLLDAQSANLSAQETAVIVDGLHHIALQVLADVAQEKGLRSSGKLAHLVNSAKSFITLNYHRHDLTLICFAGCCAAHDPASIALFNNRGLR